VNTLRQTSIMKGIHQPLVVSSKRLCWVIASLAVIRAREISSWPKLSYERMTYVYVMLVACHSSSTRKMQHTSREAWWRLAGGCCCYFLCSLLVTIAHQSLATTFRPVVNCLWRVRCLPRASIICAPASGVSSITAGVPCKCSGRIDKMNDQPTEDDIGMAEQGRCHQVYARPSRTSYNIARIVHSVNPSGGWLLVWRCRSESENSSRIDRTESQQTWDNTGRAGESAIVMKHGRNQTKNRWAECIPACHWRRCSTMAEPSQRAVSIVVEARVSNTRLHATNDRMNEWWTNEKKSAVWR